MGSSRETCNLLWILKLMKKYPNDKKYYRKRFWYVVKHQRKLMWEDTFSHIWCKIVGHKQYNARDSLHDKPELACKRCHQYIT